MADVSTQTVIVTGAGKGIGKGVAALFAKKRANVVVAEIEEHLGKKTVEEIQFKGGEAFFVKVDVRKEQDIITLMERAFEKYGRIDILINNAGKPEDIARACLYLTAKENNFVTGINLVVDGGMTRKMIYEE